MPEDRIQQLITLVRELRALYRHLYNTRPARDSAQELTHSQNELLGAVAEHKKGVTTADLADELRVSSGAITQLVEPLVTKGLLVRREHPHDRRSILIQLKHPQRPGVSFETFYAEHISPLFADLSDADLKQLITLVEKIRKENKSG